MDIHQLLNYYVLLKKMKTQLRNMGCSGHMTGLFVSQFQLSQLDPIDVEF